MSWDGGGFHHHQCVLQCAYVQNLSMEQGILKIAQQIKTRAANFEVSSGHKGMNNCEREFSLIV